MDRNIYCLLLAAISLLVAVDSLTDHVLFIANSENCIANAESFKIRAKQEIERSRTYYSSYIKDYATHLSSYRLHKLLHDLDVEHSIVEIHLNENVHLSDGEAATCNKYVHDLNMAVAYAERSYQLVVAQAGIFIPFDLTTSTITNQEIRQAKIASKFREYFERSLTLLPVDGEEEKRFRVMMELKCDTIKQMDDGRKLKSAEALLNRGFTELFHDLRKAYKQDQCTELIDDIIYEIKTLARYQLSPLEHFKTILEKVHRLNGLSYYETDLRSKESRNRAGIVPVTFWKQFDELIRELETLNEALLSKLYVEISGFIERLQSTESIENERTAMIRVCEQNVQELATTINTKKEQIRTFLVQKCIFREIRTIREARFNHNGGHDLLQNGLKLYIEQFNLLSSINVLKSETKRHISNTLEHRQKELEPHITHGKESTYPMYTRIIQELNSEGLTVFSLARNDLLSTWYSPNYPLSETLCGTPLNEINSDEEYTHSLDIDRMKVILIEYSDSRIYFYITRMKITLDREDFEAVEKATLSYFDELVAKIQQSIYWHQLTGQEQTKSLCKTSMQFVIDMITTHVDALNSGTLSNHILQNKRISVAYDGGSNVLAQLRIKWDLEINKLRGQTGKYLQLKIPYLGFLKFDDFVLFLDEARQYYADCKFKTNDVYTQLINVVEYLSRDKEIEAICDIADMSNEDLNKKMVIEQEYLKAHANNLSQKIHDAIKNILSLDNRKHDYNIDELIPHLQNINKRILSTYMSSVENMITRLTADRTICGSLITDLLNELDKLHIISIEKEATESGFSLPLVSLPNNDYTLKYFRIFDLLIKYKYVSILKRQFKYYAEIIMSRAHGSVRKYAKDENPSTHTDSSMKLSGLETVVITEQLKICQEMFEATLDDLVKDEYTSNEGMIEKFKERVQINFKQLYEILAGIRANWPRNYAIDKIFNRIISLDIRERIVIDDNFNSGMNLLLKPFVSRMDYLILYMIEKAKNRLSLPSKSLEKLSYMLRLYYVETITKIKEMSTQIFNNIKKQLRGELTPRKQTPEQRLLLAPLIIDGLMKFKKYQLVCFNEFQSDIDRIIRVAPVIVSLNDVPLSYRFWSSPVVDKTNRILLDVNKRAVIHHAEMEFFSVHSILKSHKIKEADAIKEKFDSQIKEVDNSLALEVIISRVNDIGKSVIAECISLYDHTITDEFIKSSSTITPN